MFIREMGDQSMWLLTHGNGNSLTSQ